MSFRQYGFIFLVFSTLFLSPSLFAKNKIYTSFFSKTAAGGYDVVAYFKANKAQKGHKKFMFSYKGAHWFFLNQENQKAFEAQPEKYEPQYGGYCAYAVSQGQTAKGDPLHWEIHEGKLYFNYNESIHKKWLNDKQKFINQSIKNWPGVLN